MNHNTNTKKLNNNGFSLVELIIVVAIMAVLVGVLAPQYLQYVEKSRYQTDVTMVDSIKSAVEVAIATDEKLYNDLSGDVVEFAQDGTPTYKGTDLEPEIEKVVPKAECKFTSTTCKKAAAKTIKITVDPTTKNVYMTIPAAANESSSMITK